MSRRAGSALCSTLPSITTSLAIAPLGAFSVRTVVDWTNHLAQTDRCLFGFDAALVASLPSGGDTMGRQGVSPGLALHAQLPLETVNLFGGGAMQYYSDDAGGFRFYLPWRATFETTVVEDFGAIENRNSSDVSFLALGWRFGN
jgi:hypothetical protein